MAQWATDALIMNFCAILLNKRTLTRKRGAARINSNNA